MNWKAKIKHIIPPFLLNNFLLMFPFLYRTRIVNYEANLSGNGIDDLLSQLEFVLDIEGNIIECGSSRCGSSLIMAIFLRDKNSKKNIFACDSFVGFDRRELEKEREQNLTKASNHQFTSTSYEYVKKKIAKLKFDDTVIPVKGFFQETLPGITTGFCFAFIDCDLHDSMIFSAETIWSNLTSKGCILFDDYKYNKYKGAKVAVDSFVEKHKEQISEHGLLKRLYYVRKK